MAARVRLYVLRHGKTVAHGTFYGHLDVALDDEGRSQAAAQAEALRPAGLVAVWSSDLVRAADGANLVAAAHGITVEHTSALREMSLGVLEGMARIDALAQHPALAGRSYLDMLDVRFPGGGESVHDVATRVDAWVDHALSELVSRQRGRPAAVALVAHNTVARGLLARAAGIGPAGYVRFEQRYGAVSRIDVPVREDATGRRVDWSGASIAYANRDPLGWPPGPRA